MFRVHRNKALLQKKPLNGSLLTHQLTIPERKELLQAYRFSRPPHYSTFYDFDAWVYSTNWPSPKEVVASVGGTHPHLPLGGGKCSLVVEDIKFAFNAWSLLRLGMYFGTDHPRVLSQLRNVTPSMCIAQRSNRMFYEYAEVGASFNGKAKRIALMPEHPQAVPLASIDWKSMPNGVELVLGMENGMSPAVVEQCDAWVSIPQYGSVGSLSMMAAMSIATHHAHSGMIGSQRPIISSAGSDSIDSQTTSKKAVESLPVSREFTDTRPHHDQLRGLSDTAISDLLRRCRLELPLQLSILWHNESADRNIGATVRNANAYLCEKLVVLHRRKFSRRGTIGTHHYTPVIIKKSIEEAEESGELDGYVLWQLHQEYPYLCNHVDEIHPSFILPKQTSKNETKDGESHVRFIRHDEGSMQDWIDWQGSGGGGGGAPFDIRRHPMYGCFFNGEASGKMKPPVYLDDPNKAEEDSFSTQLQEALQEVRNRGKKGVMVVVPEEGTTPYYHLLARCERVIFVVKPDRLAQSQRGLTAGMSTAVVLERLREASLRLR